MDNIPRVQLSKVPGKFIPSRCEFAIKDFNKLTTAQLFEIRDREKQLLSKKSALSKLPDKGKRIKEFYEKVENEIKHRKEITAAAELFSDLNIAETGKKKLNNLEWTKKADINENDTVIDSDDDENDPFKIIAQSTNLKKQIKVIKPEPLLITENDLIEIQSFQNDELDKLKTEEIEIDVSHRIDSIRSKLERSKNDSINSVSSKNSLELEPHVRYIIEKCDDKIPKKENFKPYKTTKKKVHETEKEKQHVQSKYWEITAATPPPLLCSSTKLLSIQDSVEIQNNYLERLKQLQKEQAEKRLAARIDNLKVSLPNENTRKLNKFFNVYREHSDTEDESEFETNSKNEEENECYDDDDNDSKSLTVSYTFHD